MIDQKYLATNKSLDSDILNDIFINFYIYVCEYRSYSRGFELHFIKLSKIKSCNFRD